MPFPHKQLVMRLWLAALAVCLSCDLMHGEERLDFTNDVMPVLTKNGCNAGACHGAAIGRGGFKLSLYGGNPTADYDAIVRQVNGRRINLAAPQKSLLVLKPAEHIEHGGGTVFDIDSRSAERLLTWIQQGAGNQTTRQLQRVVISPRKIVVRQTGGSIPLRATAHYTDGSRQDVTAWTIFSPEDKTAVNISDRETADGRATTASPQRRGRHLVIARYLSEVVPLEIIVPLTDARLDLSDEPRHNFIDERILEGLETLGLSPSPVVDDAAFLRRITLDLTGRLPTPDRVKKFMADPHDGKRLHLVDQLLDSDEFVEYWTLQFAKLLRIRPQPGDAQGTGAYHQWLAAQIRRDVSYRSVAKTLLTATGDTHENGPANFYRTVGGAREQAEFVSELFMGSRLRCANCHNHPLDRWTQDDYHGLAAIFAKIAPGRVVKVKPKGEVIHPGTLEAATQRIPGERFLDPQAEGRKQLADWLTDPHNPYFAKAVVNRLWKRMMGRGLVEPTDDFRATNPATHPALLDQLAQDFVENDYSLRHTLRLIANSATYARSATPNGQNKDDDRFYSRALRRPLEPEVLADAISDALGVQETYGDQPLGTRAVRLMDPRTPSRTLDVLGRCSRAESCETVADDAGGLPQKLHLFNGDLLNARIAAKGSRLHQMLNAKTKPMQIIHAFYLAALSRHPTQVESQHWARLVASVDDPEEFLEDFVWGLMTCNEFVTNH